MHATVPSARRHAHRRDASTATSAATLPTRALFHVRSASSTHQNEILYVCGRHAHHTHIDFSLSLLTATLPGRDTSPTEAPNSPLGGTVAVSPLPVTACCFAPYSLLLTPTHTSVHASPTLLFYTASLCTEWRSGERDPYASAPRTNHMHHTNLNPLSACDRLPTRSTASQ